MKYRIYVDESKARKDGQMPVQLIFEGGGTRFKLSTGIFSSVKFTGREFPSEEPNYRAKTVALGRRLMKVDEYLIMNENASPSTVKAALKNMLSGEERGMNPIWRFLEDYSKECSRGRTSELYLGTVKKVKAFDPTATFNSIDVDWLRRFDAWMNETGVKSINGRSTHMRNIKAVFNKAIDDGLTKEYPFRRYPVKVEKPRINNISVEQLRELRDCRVSPHVEIYRDMFLLSFYLCGMNPVDMLNLTKENVKNGRIVYTRRKTGKLYNIPLVKEAKEIINRYKGDSFLLNVMDRERKYNIFVMKLDRYLKMLGPVEPVEGNVNKTKMKMGEPIAPDATAYSARYTFASIGAELEIPRETIALCLGHSWTDVTSHYIAYDLKRIDDAVRKIIDYVNEK